MPKSIRQSIADPLVDRPTGLLKFLAYRFPNEAGRFGISVSTHEGFELHDMPPDTVETFLDFDGVVMFAGCFESISVGGWGEGASFGCDFRDLEQRHKQVFTMADKDRPVIFLMQPIPSEVPHRSVPAEIDLCRLLLKNMSIRWDVRQTAIPIRKSGEPEFDEFMSKYGAASIEFSILDERDGLEIFVGNHRRFHAFEVNRKAFFLPCHEPVSRAQAIAMASSAVAAVVAYRDRLSTSLPDWVEDFEFSNERRLRDLILQKQAEVEELEKELSSYTRRKSTLCLQANPLVSEVASILESVFQMKVKVNEQYVEDFTILNDADEIVAVAEVKGVVGNFKGTNIAQVYQHRERLELDENMPGLLIMNTMRSADSLAAKNVEPGSDTIRKAEKLNVLLVRTIDLLGFVDLVETGRASIDQFRQFVFGPPGWLKVSDGVARLVSSGS